MDDGSLRAVYCIGENPAQSEADGEQAVRRLRALDFLVVQDIFLTKTAELADVVLPATAGWAETDGTTTNSERRVQRVRRAVTPPGEAREDVDILCDPGGPPRPRLEVRRRRGRLERAAVPVPGPPRDDVRPPGGAPGHPVAVPEHRGAGTDLSARQVVADGPGPAWPARAFGIVRHDPPVDLTDEEYPIRLTTGRRLDSYNTGVERELLVPCAAASPSSCARRTPSATEWWSARGAGGLAARVGGRARVDRHRAPSPARPVLSFHFPDEVDTNQLTIEANCPIAGTAEFKASAIRIEKVSTGGPALR